MAAIDQTRIAAFNVCWARGDNDSKVFTITKADGTVENISSWTLSMAVNTEKDPSDIVNEIFQVAGVFVTDGTDGQISFTPPANSLDGVTAPGQAFYDINRVSPDKKTLVKGKVIFVMDVDKT